jgi:hypothetical protein
MKYAPDHSVVPTINEVAHTQTTGKETLKEQGKHFMENVKSQLQRILDHRNTTVGTETFQVSSWVMKINR